MELNIKQDFDAPIEYIFERMTDFEAHEKRALLADVVINSKTATPDASTWNVTFEWRGKERNAEIEVSEIIKNEHMSVVAASPNLFAEADLKFLSLSPLLTRIRLKSTLKSKTLKARLMIQSARIAKKSIEKRLQNRLGGLAAELEFDYSQLG